jgi:hypothetical protein
MTELDEATKAKLRAEAARLVSMGMAADKARRIVWDDYLEELAAYAAAAQPVATTGAGADPGAGNTAPSATAPDPVLPGPEPPARTSRFWDAKRNPG